MVAARQPFCYIWGMKIEEKYISETVRKGIGLLAEIHKRKHEAFDEVLRMIEPRGNTLETIEKECSEPGWFYTYDNRPNEAISAKVIQRAKLIRPYVPMEMELFAAPDGSVQWEDDRHTLEVYPDKYRYDDEEVSFAEALKKLSELEYNQKEFKLELTFPKEFREHFQRDRFKDSLGRLAFDARELFKEKLNPKSSAVCTLSGLLEVELIEKIRDAVASGRVVNS